MKPTTVSRTGARTVPRAALPSALCAALLLLSACSGDEDPPDGPGPVPYARCAELSDSLFPAAQRDYVPHFKVVTPNGGSFRTGQEMRVVVAGVDYTSALVDLVVFGPGGGAARIPGFPANGAIKPHEKCEWRFAIPDSVTTLVGGRRIPLVSDSVKVKVYDYSLPEESDYSDAFISVSR